MIGLHQDRAAAEAASNRCWSAQPAEQNRRRATRQDPYEVMSPQRSGDTRFTALIGVAVGFGTGDSGAGSAGGR